MKKVGVKRLIVSTLLIALLLDMIQVPDRANAAVKSASVTTQADLNKALTDKEVKVVNLKNIEEKAVTVDAGQCDNKTLNINTKDVNIKNNSTFKVMRLFGSSNTLYNYANNPCISVYADSSKLIVGKNAKINMLKIQGNNNILKTYEGTEVNKLYCNKENAELTIMADGKLDGIYIKKAANLNLSGSAAKVILKNNAKGTEIISSVRLVARFSQDAVITLEAGAEQSILKVNDNCTLKVSNKTDKELSILTTTGSIIVKPGEVKDSTGKEYSHSVTTDTNPGIPGGSAGAIGGGSADTGSSIVTPAITLSDIELDSETADLTNQTAGSKLVTIKPYVDGKLYKDYILYAYPVSVNLVSASLTNGYHLSREDVANNSNHYYTIDFNKVTFLGQNLLPGTYVYEICAGTFKKQFTLTITGEAELASQTVLLPYLISNPEAPLTKLTVDAVVNSEADAHKTVSYGFYSKVGDCYKAAADLTDYKYEIYSGNGSLIQEGAMGSYVLAGRSEKPLEFMINSVNNSVVSKAAADTYTINITQKVNEKNVIKSVKLKVVDSQSKAVITQNVTNVKKSYIQSTEKFPLPLYEQLFRYYNNAVRKPTSSIINDYTSMTNVKDKISENSGSSTAYNSTLDGFYLQYGLQQCGTVSFNGINYELYDSRVAFPKGVYGTVAKGNADIAYDTTQSNANTIRSAKISEVTVYLDIANWGKSGNGSKLYVPFKISDAGIELNFLDDIFEESRFIICKQAINFQTEKSDNHFLPLDGQGYSMYMKFIDKLDKEITNYNKYSVVSLNPEIVTIANNGSIDSTTKSCALNPISDGTATLNVVDASTKAVVTSVQIHVGTLNASDYEIKASESELTLNKGVIPDAKSITLQMFDKNTKEEEKNWVALNDSNALLLELVGGVDENGAKISDETIAGYQTIIHHELFDHISESEASIVTLNENKLTFKESLHEESLPAGTYQFEITSYGVTNSFTLHVTAAKTEGEVSYALLQDHLAVDLSTYNIYDSLSDQPLTIKVVKRMDGVAVDYMDVTSVTFTDENLGSKFYDPDAQVLHLAKTEPVDEFTYKVTELAPVGNSEFTVTYKDDEGNLQQLTGDIQITDSQPVTVTQKQTTIDTVGLSDAYNTLIWNKETTMTDEEKALLKNQLSAYIAKNYIKLNRVANDGMSYGVESSSLGYEFVNDPETGYVTGVKFSLVKYIPERLQQAVYMGSYVGLCGISYEFTDLNLQFTFK